MSEEELRELEQQEAEANASQHKSALEKYDEVTEKIDDIRDTVQKFKDKKNPTGSTEVSSAGTEAVSNAGNVVSNAGNIASNTGNTVSNAASNASKVSEASAKAQKAAATAAEKGAQAGKATAKGGKAASKGAQAGGKGMQAAGKGMQAAGNSPYTAGLKAAGAGVEGAGRGIEGVGKAGEAAATSAEATAAAAEASAKAQKAAANAQLTAAQSAKAANAAGQAAKAGVKAPADKTTADKLRDRSKINKWINKRADNKAKKFSPKNALNDFFEGFGEVGEALKNLIKVFNPITLIVIFLLFMIVSVIFLFNFISPMYYMDQIRSSTDTVEKLDNFFSGLGFEDCKEAFNKEIEYLDTHYDKQLDYSYIMAALYYVDVFHSNDKFYNEDKSIGYATAKYFIKECESTTDETTGLVYSANKIYRLRALAKAQFLGEKQLSSSSLSDYITNCLEKMDNENKNLMKYFPYVIGSALFGPAFDTFINAEAEKDKIMDIIAVFQGTENWNSIRTYVENGKYDSGLKYSIENFISTFLGCFFNIESISFNFDIGTLFLSTIIGPVALANGITVNYYEYSFGMDEYEDYLVDHYIREMPEFSELIKDENGNINDDRVLQIAYEIKMTRDYYNQMFNEKAASEEIECIGDINLDLLSELGTPVSLTEGQKITFSGTNNYGFYKGKVHNGVDLEAGSTNTKQGDNVYSIYAGKVAESTVDGTFQDKSVKGGWVVIQYTVRFDDSSMGDSKLGKAYKTNYSTISVYYGGLDPNSLTLKQGSSVKKGQVIGKVGSAAVSENGTKPSVHFAIYDHFTNKFINPINMFITCRAGTNDKMCGVTNEQKIWTFLLSKGYSKEAAAAIMGIWERESGLKPYMRQGYFGKESKTKQYTADVDSGKISRKKFINGGKDGYGLAQWTTADRKGNLYDLSKKMGKSIGSAEVQMEFFEQEMKGSYKVVKKSLSKATTIEAAAEAFFKNYQGVRKSDFTKYHFDLRVDNAKKIYEKYKNYTCKE